MDDNTQSTETENNEVVDESVQALLAIKKAEKAKSKEAKMFDTADRDELVKLLNAAVESEYTNKGTEPNKVIKLLIAIANK